MRRLGPGRPAAVPNSVLRWSMGIGIVVAALTGGVEGTEDAVANGDTRALPILHQHTGESATITFRRNGRYDPEGLKQLNWILRDWRVEQAAKMDPRLFDTVWELYRSVGASEPIHIISAYRSPQTNAMLRSRSRRVSEHSQHMQGKAIDLRLPDVPVDTVRAAAMRLQHGGVGYYAGSFVHVDVGSVRAWPRMSRDQLVRLFPDGKTVHLPADGRPLPGYEQARAELLARGDTVLGYSQVASADEGSFGKSLWGMLFGRKDDEDSEFYAAQGGAGARAAARPAPARPAPSRPVQVASAGDDAGVRAPLAFAASETTSAIDGTAARSPVGRASTALASAAGIDDAPKGMTRAPLPPRRPDEFTALASLAASAPMPPSRPVERVASADPDALPLPSGLRLATYAGPTEAAPKAPERSGLRALFAAAATRAGTVSRRITTAVTRAKPHGDIPPGLITANAESGLKGQFSMTADTGPVTGRFAGSAVATVASLR